MPRTCSYGLCKNNAYTPNCRFFKFPDSNRDPERRELWAIKCRRKTATGKTWRPPLGTAGVHVCSSHFMSGEPWNNKLHPDYAPCLESSDQKSSASSLAALRRFSASLMRAGVPVSTLQPLASKNLNQNPIVQQQPNPPINDEVSSVVATRDDVNTLQAACNNRNQSPLQVQNRLLADMIPNDNQAEMASEICRNSRIEVLGTLRRDSNVACSRDNLVRPVKLFPCTHCEKSFTRSNHLKKHLTKHTREEPSSNFENVRFELGAGSSSFDHEADTAPVEFKEEVQDDNDFGQALMNYGQLAIDSILHSGNPEYQDKTLSQYLAMTSSVISLDHSYSCQIYVDNASLEFPASAEDSTNEYKAEPVADSVTNDLTRETLFIETSDSILPPVTSNCTDFCKVPSVNDTRLKKPCRQTVDRLRVRLRGEKRNKKSQGTTSRQKAKKSALSKVARLSSARKNANVLKKKCHKKTAAKPFAHNQGAKGKRRVRTDTVDKPFPCAHCEKKFRLLASLKAHLHIHTTEKPFTCTHCKMDFRCSNGLNNHLTTHSCEKQPAKFACARCGMVFLYSVSLKNHIVEIHNGEMPYTCSHCSSRFSNLGGLKTHVAIVHGIKMQAKDGSQASQGFSPVVNSNLRREEDLSELDAGSSSFGHEVNSAPVQFNEIVQNVMNFRQALMDYGQLTNDSTLDSHQNASLFDVEIKLEAYDCQEIDRNASADTALSLDEPISEEGDLIHVIKPEFDETSDEEIGDCEKHKDWKLLVNPFVELFPVTNPRTMTSSYQLFH